VTAQAVKTEPGAGSATEAAEPPAYVVVLARLLVDSALRGIRERGAANNTESTLVVREDE